MIIDFPEAQTYIAKIISQYVNRQIRERSKLLSMMNPVHVVHEGDRIGIHREDGSRESKPLTLHKSEVQITGDNGVAIGAEELVKGLDDMVGDMSRQLEKSVVSGIQDIAEKGENTVSGSMDNIESMQDMLLQSMENMHIDFKDGDRNKPILPSLLVHPTMGSKLAELASGETQIQKDNFKEREKKILDEKYKDYINDINSRIIVD